MFERLERIIGKDKIELLNKNRVLVIGLGGVGGMALETLIRNGIEDIVIVDKDTIDITNKNRQVIALDSNIGEYKTDAFEKRILDINSNVKITKITDYINESNIELLFDTNPDYIIDACDDSKLKIDLLRYAKDKGWDNQYDAIIDGAKEIANSLKI